MLLQKGTNNRSKKTKICWHHFLATSHFVWFFEGLTAAIAEKRTPNKVGVHLTINLPSRRSSSPAKIQIRFLKTFLKV
jgi:hypothetical protein